MLKYLSSFLDLDINCDNYTIYGHSTFIGTSKQKLLPEFDESIALYYLKGTPPWDHRELGLMIDNQGKITMRTSITLDSTNHSLIMKAKGGGNSINIMGETGDIELFDAKTTSPFPTARLHSSGLLGKGVMVKMGRLIL